MTTHRELTPDELRWRCPEEQLPFNSSDDIEPLAGVIGQQRAIDAITLGLELDSDGYNIFVTGLTGADRIPTIQQILEQSKKPEAAHPSDICCVHNFKDPDAPKIISLPAGQGSALKKDMAEFIDALKKNIPQIFESEEYKSRRKAITEGFQEKQKEIIKEFEKKVDAENFKIVQMQVGPFNRPAILPVVMGNPMPLEQVESLVDKDEYPKETFERIKEKHAELSAEMESIFSDLQKKEQDFEARLKKLDKELVSPLLKDSVTLIEKKFGDGKLGTYLADLTENLLDNFGLFLPQRPKEGQAPIAPPPDVLTEYQVNVLVDNAETEGAPIIIEKNPVYRNLFGGIEKVLDPRYGVWRTDFSRIKAGSLLKANGGYLVVNFMDAALEPGVWTTLKRVLKNRSIEVQSFDPMYLFTMSTLQPEPIDLDVKVVLLGDSRLYHLLYTLDEDFKDIFKIKADFDPVLNNEGKVVSQYASFIRKTCDDKGLLPFEKSGMAAIIEYGVRLGGRRKKLSSRFHQIADVLAEAHYWAKKDGVSLVAEKHVDRAIENRVYRVNLIESKIQEMIEDNILLIDTDGSAVGQVNGLSVYDLGDHSFGKPSRITAKTSMGRAGIINIEREADLSGKTHNKGILILAGYLRDKYAQDKPLTMSASICFEQSYGGIDGDSASSTEIYAVLSSLAALPLRQDLAITGSVNQNGEIQPIGGVNQKIEGFYDVCRTKKLTGTQGVMIPIQNLGDLMLRKDVVEAVQGGHFHIYPISTIDEGIELLTGKPAGTRDEDGAYPQDTVNFLVDKKLRSLAEGLKKFGSVEKNNKNSEENSNEETSA